MEHSEALELRRSAAVGLSVSACGAIGALGIA
jgi:hypothetical protein